MSEPRKPRKPRRGAGGALEHRSVRNIISSKAIEIIIGTLLLGSLTVLATMWTRIESSFQSYVVDAVAKDKDKLRQLVANAVVDELSRSDSILSKSIGETYSKLRISEVGALSVGNFTLTRANDSYVVYIYFPEGHTGKLSYKLSGPVIPGRRYVTVVSPNGTNNPIVNMEGVTDIPKNIMPVPGTQAAPNGTTFEEKSAFLESLRAFTFQLVERLDDETDQPKINLDAPRVTIAGATLGRGNPRIEVSYVALVAPALHIGK